MTTQAEFEDGRGQYPDVIRARAPRGLRGQLKEAAAQEGLTVGELIRQALNARLEDWRAGVAAVESIPPEVSDAIDLGEDLVRRWPEVRELLAQMRPAIVAHLKQAHDCLGLVIKGYEEGGADASGHVTYGYLVQHTAHMREAEELTKTLARLALNCMQEGA